MPFTRGLPPDLPEPVTPHQPDPALSQDALLMIAKALERLSGSQLTTEQLSEMMSRTAAAATKAGAEGMRQALHPQNDQDPGMSVFSHPEGEIANPKTVLLRETFFVGARMRDDLLTPTEILLFNKLVPGDYHAGQWTVRTRLNGLTDQVHVFVPCATNDQRMELPSLVAILSEMVYGPTAGSLDSMAARVADLEAQLAQRAG